MITEQVEGELENRRIILGLSGGAACFKAAQLCRLFVRAGAAVQVVMTDAAQHFITATAMQALSGQPVFTSQWDERPANRMAHIDLTRDADAVVVAPASADFIAQLAQGRADELLALLCLARPAARVPLLLAPSMNREMWAHPATQRNVVRVRADGAQVAGVGFGEQACGETGAGRMLEPEQLLEETVALLTPKRLAGKKVVVTAGPTFEAIDPVRGITNRSSGKMGFALARAAREAGGRVTLIAGPVHQGTPLGVQRVDVMSAREMHGACMEAASDADVFIAAAAVADWRPARTIARKIKKSAGGLPPSLELVENADILAEVARSARARSGALFCVGFAAESENVRENGQAKRERKGVPLLVANDGPATFGSDDNEVLLIDDERVIELPREHKRALARRLIEEIAQRVSGIEA